MTSNNQRITRSLRSKFSNFEPEYFLRALCKCEKECYACKDLGYIDFFKMLILKSLRQPGNSHG